MRSRPLALILLIAAGCVFGKAAGTRSVSVRPVTPFYAGKPVQVSWECSGDTRDVRVTLCKDGPCSHSSGEPPHPINYLINIKSSENCNHRLTWSSLHSLASGHDYFFCVEDYVTETVRDCTRTTIRAGEIEIHAGQQALQAGQPVHLSWVCTGPDIVKLTLCKGGPCQYNAGSSDPNFIQNIHDYNYCDHRAQFTWSIPRSLASRNDYYFCAQDREAISVRGCVLTSIKAVEIQDEDGFPFWIVLLLGGCCMFWACPCIVSCHRCGSSCHTNTTRSHSVDKFIAKVSNLFSTSPCAEDVEAGPPRSGALEVEDEVTAAPPHRPEAGPQEEAPAAPPHPGAGQQAEAQAAPLRPVAGRKAEGQAVPPRPEALGARMEERHEPVLPREVAAMLPPYWSGLKPPLQGWLLGIPDSDTRKSLAGLLHVAEPSELGKGRDAKGYPRPYNHLDFFAAWRVEHPALWKSYEAKKDEIAQRVANLARHAVGGHTPEVAPALPGRGSASLPGGPDLNRSINEVFLLCGTPPENVLAIIDQGLNSNISKMDGLLGPGIYFAEKPEKMDQYTRPDSTFKKAGLEQLHARLFRGAFGIKHPGEDLFYCLVVRVALGWPAHTKDGTTCLENATPVFHGDDKRELAHVPLKPSGPLSVPYHSLVCEAGAGCYLQRFREFVIKGNPQCYVEYVVAYKRTMKL